MDEVKSNSKDAVSATLPLRFSLRTLFLLFLIVAMVFGAYDYGRKSQQYENSAARVNIIISVPYEMSSPSEQLENFKTVASILSNPRMMQTSRQEKDPPLEQLWPPKVWVTRPEWNGSKTLEEVIEIECTGTFLNPILSNNLKLEDGDRVFIDFGRPKYLQPSTQPTSISENPKE